MSMGTLTYVPKPIGNNDLGRIYMKKKDKVVLNEHRESEVKDSQEKDIDEKKGSQEQADLNGPHKESQAS
jgi:hypothetical protein